MPTFQGLVSEEQLNALVAYVKSQSQPVASRNQTGADRRRSARQDRRKSGAMSMATTTVQPVERENYLNKHYGVGSWLFTTDHKRIALLYLHLDHVLLFHRRLLRAAHPPRTAHARRRPRPGRHLQQTLHHARHGHGLLLPHPIDSRRAGQLPRAHDDRRQGPRLPAHQPAELVSLHHRRRHDAALHAHRRRRYRLDLLHALQHRLHQHQNRRGRTRHLRRRILFHPHRPEFHRHHPPHARPRHDLVAPAAVHLGALRHQHHPDSRHARHRHHHRAGRRRTHPASRHLRSQTRRRSAALPASVLVLFASRRLHHDSAVDGRRHRNHRLLLAQAHLRLQLRRLLLDRHRRLRIPGLGASHVRRRNLRLRRAGLLSAELCRRRALRRQSLQLDRHSYTKDPSTTTRPCSTPSASSACSPWAA